MNLSPRQQEIAELVVQGYSNKRIARELRISIKTVEFHVERAAHRIGGDGKPRLIIARWYFTKLAA